jgi:uncharacterized protein YndB with AHSA1/START domain
MATIGETGLEFRRTYAAPRERIYRAWTEAEGLKRWLSPSDANVAKAHADARAGGGWGVTMHGAEGQEYVVAGEYVELKPPELVVLTWRWAHEPEEAASRVTVHLREVAGGTELRLVHEGLAGEAKASHADGWEQCLDKLEAFLA